MANTPEKSKMTVEEAGRLGGEKVSRERGPAFYSAIGKKGGEARKEQGTNYRELGRKGGEKVKEEKGPQFFSEIGRKGGEARHAAAALRAKNAAEKTVATRKTERTTGATHPGA
jgi:hypothetical protein